QRPCGLFSPKAAVLGAANRMKQPTRNISYVIWRKINELTRALAALPRLVLLSQRLGIVS
ncbi:hypothetical protein, partial [Methylobacter sp. BlB1]|uniref:hypothetical protein n=1 Tax=Methylobacter sp. BlB1 TaxID=2785914 RepID=UPI001E5615E4